MKSKRGLPILSIALPLLLVGSCTVPLTLNRLPAEGGFVQPEDQQKFGKKKPIDISAIPADEHRFVNWTLDDGDAQISDPNSAATSVVLRSAATVTANFERIFTLTASANPADGGTVDLAMRQNITASMSVDISAAAADGYRFVNWTVASGEVSFADASGAHTTVTLGENTNIIANFQRVFVLSLNAAPTIGGNVVSAGGAIIDADTPTEIVAMPLDGFRFVNWTVTSGQAQIADPNSANTTVSISEDATVVANFQLLPGAQFNPGVTYGEIIDARDNKRYRTVVIGGLVWMAQNLNHETSGSNCYDNDPENCEIYGRLYDWPSAFLACPAGWRLPDTSDWNNLTANTNGVIRARAGWDNFNREAADRFGFSALPSGVRNASGNFMRRGTGAAWWSDTDTGNRAFGSLFGVNNDNLSRNNFDKNTRMAVRCVRGDIRYSPERDFRVVQRRSWDGTKVVMTDSVEIVNYSGNRRDVRIPPTIQGKPVVAISGVVEDDECTSACLIGAFAGKRLTSVVIPNSVTGVDGFYHNQLTSITIPNSVRYIAGYAFGGNQLTNITIGSNVELDDGMGHDPPSFDHGFVEVYNLGGHRAGTYISINGGGKRAHDSVFSVSSSLRLGSWLNMAVIDSLNRQLALCGNDSHCASIMFQLASFYYSAHDFSTAIQTFQRLLDEYPTNQFAEAAQHRLRGAELQANMTQLTMQLAECEGDLKTPCANLANIMYQLGNSHYEYEQRYSRFSGNRRPDYSMVIYIFEQLLYRQPNFEHASQIRQILTRIKPRPTRNRR